MTENIWQPIETAPRDGTTIIVHVQYDQDPCVVSWNGIYRCWSVSTEHYDTSGDARVIGTISDEWIKFWMPVPAAPNYGDCK